MMVLDDEWVLVEEGLVAIALPIDEMECRAFAAAMEVDVGICDARVVLSDNTVASRAFHKGFSKSEGVYGWIFAAFHQYWHLQRRDAPHHELLLIVDVPSEENIADIGTRPHRTISAEERMFRERASSERAARALEYFRRTRGSYADRRYLQRPSVADGSTAMDGVR
jgi:hypothetical protein